MNKIDWKLTRNSTILLFQENVFENVFCKMVTILSTHSTSAQNGYMGEWSEYQIFTKVTQKEWLNLKISQILPKESGSKRKNDTQQEYVWHLKTQPEGVTEVKTGGVKGGTSLLTLTEGEPRESSSCEERLAACHLMMCNLCYEHFLTNLTLVVHQLIWWVMKCNYIFIFY